MSTAANLLAQLSRLTPEEFEAFFSSGSFTGFSERDLAQADDNDRAKMEFFNAALRICATAKRLEWRRGRQ